MKCEEISDALGLLEEGMICHALMVSEYFALRELSIFI